MHILRASVSAMCGVQIERRTSMIVTCPCIVVFFFSGNVMLRGKKGRKGTEACVRLGFLNLRIFAMSLRLNIDNSEVNLSSQVRKPNHTPFTEAPHWSPKAVHPWLPLPSRRTWTQKSRAFLICRANTPHDFCLPGIWRNFTCFLSN